MSNLLGENRSRGIIFTGRGAAGMTDSGKMICQSLEIKNVSGTGIVVVEFRTGCQVRPIPKTGGCNPVVRISWVDTSSGGRDANLNQKMTNEL